MFKIVHTGPGRDAVRIESDARLTPEEFKRIACDLARPIVRARKVGFVAARLAQADETVETRWNGAETTNTAHEGDWIVTNLSPEQQAQRDRDGQVNAYVIQAERFPDLYEPAGGRTNSGSCTAPRAWCRPSGCPAASTSWRRGATASGRRLATSYVTAATSTATTRKRSQQPTG